MNSGSYTGISSENQWEFLMKSYNDLGYGNWTAGTTTASFDHDDKDQGVGSGATYCFYLYGYFDLAKEWESKLQGLLCGHAARNRPREGNAGAGRERKSRHASP